MSPAAVLAAYRYQPNLERRHHVLKGPQEVAPVHLEAPHRIEALLTGHFFAQLVEALVEREIRTAMRERGLNGIALYPELRDCSAPSAARVLEIFNDVQRHRLTAAERWCRSSILRSRHCSSRCSSFFTSPRPSTRRAAPLERDWGEISASRSAERQLDG